MPLITMDHPLIQHNVTLLRDKSTSIQQFRALVDRITLLMTFELTRDFELETTHVETPLQSAEGKTLKKKPIVLVPILRAGLGMVNGALTLLADASVAHVGLERDHETFEPRTYYHKLPPSLDGKEIIVLDPMLATGVSICRTLSFLVDNGANPDKLKIMCLVVAPEGVAIVDELYPHIPIYTAALDQGLNEKAYIVPGLGDAGDRLFGTV